MSCPLRGTLNVMKRSSSRFLVCILASLPVLMLTPQPASSETGGLPPALAGLVEKRGLGSAPEAAESEPEALPAMLMAQEALPPSAPREIPDASGDATGLQTVSCAIPEGNSPASVKADAPIPRLPLSLAAAVKTALDGNLEFLAAADEVRMARETVGEALTYTAPRLKVQNFQTWVGHVTSIGGMSIGDRHTDISKLILQQALYTFGKAETGLRLAELEREMKSSILDGARQDLILRTVKAYAGLLKVQKGVEVAQESVEVIEKYLAQVESQFKAGVVLQTDVLATRVRLLETRQKLIDAKNARSLALRSLCNILTVPPDPGLTFADVPESTGIGATSAQATEAARRNLPEIRQLEILRSVNSAQIDLEVRKRLPNIALQAAWESGSQFNQHDDNWNATVVFEGQILDSGESRHRIRRARLAQDKTVKLLAFLKQNNDFAIEADLIRVSETGDQMALAGEIIATAKANAEQTRYQYNNGMTLNTDVLNAELALSGARFGYYNSRYDHFTARADLYRHMGRMDDFLSLAEPAWRNGKLENQSDDLNSDRRKK